MFDGVFIHYLIKELQVIVNNRINKVNVVTSSEMFFTLSSRVKLYISLNSDSMHLRLTTIDLVNSPQRNSFQTVIKKYLESSVINSITQYGNDRIIIFNLTHFDELGYEAIIKLYIECFGRNSNMILTNEEDIIIDCYRRLHDLYNDQDNRIIVPKAKYTPPVSDKVNPYLARDNFITWENCFEGISSLLFGEISYTNDLQVIHKDCKPILIETPKKKYFYAFDLCYLEGKRTYFESLSKLLEYYFLNCKNDLSQNNEQLFLKNYITKEIEKTTNKTNKQKAELEKASKDIYLEKYGEILKCNLHLIKKGSKEVKAFDYETNSEVIIPLNPLLTPNQNLTTFFKKYQKAKRGSIIIKEQIDKSQDDLEYLKCLLNQLSLAKSLDLVEMYQELNIKGKITEKARKSKPNITSYQTKDGDQIWVGKNNIQNNYLTNSFAKSTDYFFHVQNVPGSHVILRTTKLTEENIMLAGMIAAYYSSYRQATNVCVDYTLIKNVHKIPKMKGSFVTYKNQKSVFAKPDIEEIKIKTI